MENAPTNWHLISITFDPEHDTPEMLKAYGAAYPYNPEHWSFLTGPPDKIAELARLCDVTFDSDNGLFNHNFRTLIIDASNRLQWCSQPLATFLNLIVQELPKAAGGTNRITKPPQTMSAPGQINIIKANDLVSASVSNLTSPIFQNEPGNKLTDRPSYQL